MRGKIPKTRGRKVTGGVCGSFRFSFSIAGTVYKRSVYPSLHLPVCYKPCPADLPCPNTLPMSSQLNLIFTSSGTMLMLSLSKIVWRCAPDLPSKCSSSVRRPDVDGVDRLGSETSGTTDPITTSLHKGKSIDFAMKIECLIPASLTS